MEEARNEDGMKASRALEIEIELRKEIPEQFYTGPEQQECRKDRAAYEAMKAVQKYRKFLLALEVRGQDGLDCRHDICPDCGANLDADEICDCKKNTA